MSTAWATMALGSTRSRNRVIAGYVFAGGVRRFPYLTSLTTKTLKYSDVKGFLPNKDVHSVGTIWSSMLYKVYWNMVKQGGFEADVTNFSSTAGNIRFMHILVLALKMQPCNPTMLQARQALLDAELSLTRGLYACAIWRGFSKRGLGIDAANYVNSEVFLVTWT
ncbi:Fungalysin/Thermolysin Extracellular metalloproteinase 5 [Phlyctochytrium bullatum]|nr:Fungalysin/Thermolysin Extracellular metalloproteinase 5 [Phlyctochytrium bullatum]